MGLRQQQLHLQHTAPSFGERKAGLTAQTPHYLLFFGTNGRSFIIMALIHFHIHCESCWLSPAVTRFPVCLPSGEPGHTRHLRRAPSSC